MCTVPTSAYDGNGAPQTDLKFKQLATATRFGNRGGGGGGGEGGPQMSPEREQRYNKQYRTANSRT